jgi:PAS domain S-box-containing protein
MDELVRAGSRLSLEQNFSSLVSVLVEQTIDISFSDLACLYLKTDLEQPEADYKLIYRRGRFECPPKLSFQSETIRFQTECHETVVITERKPSPFADIFLNSQMQSAIALPLLTSRAIMGVLILNDKKSGFYNREKFSFLDAFCKLAGGMLQNAKLYQELKDYLKRIEEIERYQQNIFSSMTNLLITTDKEGCLQYYNAAAAIGTGLTDEDIGSKLQDYFKDRLGKKILETIKKSREEMLEYLGIEGILKGKDKTDIDFSLNISPLKDKRGNGEGITLLFTDQSREQELQEAMTKVVEERRIIKDMFSRYLSVELVQQLVDNPNLVNPFGSKKEATIFFADIRGYTSFSEGQDPAYIIGILNAYFSEAVEIVIRHRGYIDKFIGDCIMAAWGVPMQSEKQDAINAVTCALEIQKLVGSKTRNFFTGKAADLKIGIGMHSGPLVAGNLGSRRHMDYTVIGDTVNVAARLEGVAKAGEVIITEATRNYLGDQFKLEKREPVTVKGKSKPIPIYAVYQ